MAQVTLSGKVQRVYEGRRFTNGQGQQVDAISFDLCVSREGADEKVSLLNPEQKNKCDFYRCNLYGKKAVDFYTLTANTTKRIVTITGNMLQEEKPCTNRPVHIGKENPLYQLLSQYVQASNGVITADSVGDLWIKGDYIFDKAVKINVHSFNFLDNPNAQNNQFGMESASSNLFGQPSFGGQASNGQFGVNTAGSFGQPQAQQQVGFPATQGNGGFPQPQSGFPATQQANTGFPPAQSGFPASSQAGGFPPANVQGGFPATSGTSFGTGNNGFEVTNPQPQQTQVSQQVQGVAGFTAPTQEPAGFTPVASVVPNTVAQAQQTQAPVETNIPAPSANSQSAMTFAPVAEDDGKRPF